MSGLWDHVGKLHIVPSFLPLPLVSFRAHLSPYHFFYSFTGRPFLLTAVGADAVGQSLASLPYTLQAVLFLPTALFSRYMPSVGHVGSALKENNKRKKELKRTSIIERERVQKRKCEWERKRECERETVKARNTAGFNWDWIALLQFFFILSYLLVLRCTWWGGARVSNLTRLSVHPPWSNCIVPPLAESAPKKLHLISKTAKVCEKCFSASGY